MNLKREQLSDKLNGFYALINSTDDALSLLLSPSKNIFSSSDLFSLHKLFTLR